MKIMIKDVKYDYDQFEIVYDEKNIDYTIEFEVNRIISWDIDDSPMETEKYLKAIVKWDGCSHICFGNTKGYLYIDGNNGFNNHANLMKELFQIASRVIKNFDIKLAIR